MLAGRYRLDDRVRTPTDGVAVARRRRDARAAGAGVRVSRSGVRTAARSSTPPGAPPSSRTRGCSASSPPGRSAAPPYVVLERVPAGRWPSCSERPARRGDRPAARRRGRGGARPGGHPGPAPPAAAAHQPDRGPRRHRDGHRHRDRRGRGRHRVAQQRRRCAVGRRRPGGAALRGADRPVARHPGGRLARAPRVAGRPVPPGDLVAGRPQRPRHALLGHARAARRRSAQPGRAGRAARALGPAAPLTDPRGLHIGAPGRPGATAPALRSARTRPPSAPAEAPAAPAAGAEPLAPGRSTRRSAAGRAGTGRRADRLTAGSGRGRGCTGRPQPPPPPASCGGSCADRCVAPPPRAAASPWQPRHRPPGPPSGTSGRRWAHRAPAVRPGPAPAGARSTTPPAASNPRSTTPAAPTPAAPPGRHHQLPRPPRRSRACPRRRDDGSVPPRGAAGSPARAPARLTRRHVTTAEPAPQRVRAPAAPQMRRHRTNEWRDEPTGGLDALEILGSAVQPEEPPAPFAPTAPLDRPPRAQSRLVLVVLAVLLVVLFVFAVTRFVDFHPSPLIDKGGGAPSAPGASASAPHRRRPSLPRPRRAALRARPHRSPSPGPRPSTRRATTTRTTTWRPGRSTATPRPRWHSDRYSSPEFGGSRRVSGSAVDLGEASTVTSVTVTAPGTDGTIELRTADGPDVGGSTRRRDRPAHRQRERPVAARRARVHPRADRLVHSAP